VKKLGDYKAELQKLKNRKAATQQKDWDVIRAMVEARIAKKLTQKELAERTGINQADISKLENGTRNPSINLLKRIAEGMDMVLKIEFLPKKNL